MPASPAKTTVTTEAAAPRGVQAGIPVIIGYDSTYATANKPVAYFNPDAVATAHGSATKTTKAAKALFKNGASKVIIIKPTVTAVTNESKGTAAEGTLANVPITDTAAVTFEADTVAKTVVPTTEDPIAATPQSSEVLLNFYTGEYKLSGAATTSVIVDYSYIDFTKMVQALKREAATHGPYELFVFPDYPLNKESYGDIKKMADKAKDEHWLVLAHFPNGETVANAKALRTALNNVHIALFAHKDSTNDVAASVAGVASRTDPWLTLAYKKVKELDTEYYDPSDIGDVETADSFEGEGINVIHKLGNVDVPTNERTAVAYGGTDTEIYVSRLRTRIHLKHRLDTRLERLVLENPNVRFDETGVGAGSAAVHEVLEELVAKGAITRDYTVEEPVLTDITSADKKKRSLGPYRVTAEMVEGAHEIRVDTTLQVA